MTTISGTPEAWKQVAVAVKQRRIGELGMNQAGLQAAGGPTISTISLIERASKTSYEIAGIWKLENALGWKRGSIQAILDGGEATLAQTTPDPVTVDAGARFQRNRTYPEEIAPHPLLRYIYDAPPEIATGGEIKWALRGVHLYWEDVGGHEGAVRVEEEEHTRNVDERA